MTNTFILSPRKNSSRQDALSQRIVECWLRQNHGDYQQFLIKAKELELQILEQETRKKHIFKTFDKKKKQISDLETQLKRGQNQSIQKKLYLQNYYQFLNSKLKNGPQPINLFSSLDLIEKGLQEKFQAEKNTLESGIFQLRILQTSLNDELRALQNKKCLLKEEYITIKQQKQDRKNEEQKSRKIERQKRLKEIQELESLLERKNKMEEEKSKLQRQQTVLKKLLNVQEVHTKYWLMMENSIKQQFLSRVQENCYKETLGMQYKLKMPELQSELGMRTTECQVKQQELEERKQIKRGIEESMNTKQEKYRVLNEGRMSQFNQSTR